MSWNLNWSGSTPQDVGSESELELKEEGPHNGRGASAAASQQVLVLTPNPTKGLSVCSLHVPLVRACFCFFTVQKHSKLPLGVCAVMGLLLYVSWSELHRKQIMDRWQEEELNSLQLQSKIGKSMYFAFAKENVFFHHDTQSES